jgi:glycine cleavage system transcriptional repressor
VSNVTAPLAVTAIGNDRPGIVAGVTRALYEAGCNLEDATSTILRGHFAMMLVVRPPGGADAAAVEAGLRPIADDLGLVVTVKEVDEVGSAVPMPTHMVSVYGADRPGIVYRVAEVLARRGVNITDLESRVTGAVEHPVYALMLEVEMSQPEAVEADLAEIKNELGVDVTVRHMDADIF